MPRRRGRWWREHSNRRCPVSTIIGGGFPEIRAECQRYHGKTTSKREDKGQCCDEGLHGWSPSAFDQNDFRTPPP